MDGGADNEKLFECMRVSLTEVKLRMMEWLGDENEIKVCTSGGVSVLRVEELGVLQCPGGLVGAFFERKCMFSQQYCFQLYRHLIICSYCFILMLIQYINEEYVIYITLVCIREWIPGLNSLNWFCFWALLNNPKPLPQPDKYSQVLQVFYILDLNGLLSEQWASCSK